MNRPTRTYANGQPWRQAQGQEGGRQEIADHLASKHAVVDLQSHPSAIKGFLRWYSGSLSSVGQEDVREYLDLLVLGAC